MKEKRRNPSTDAEARLAAIVESSFDAIISKDLGSIVTSWNHAAETLFGYSADEVIGQSILLIIPDYLHDEEADIIARIKQAERIASYETVRQRRDGTRFPVSITVSPIMDTAGAIIGASTIARDISKARENEQRIRQLLREVNHRVKNQFAVILSMIRETRKRSDSPLDFESKVRERIMALSRSHDLLVSTEWGGAGLVDLITEHVQQFGQEGQVSLSGPMLTLQPNAVQHLGMAFHELAINSMKFGALSSPKGRVSIEWGVEDEENAPAFWLNWKESYAPAAGYSDESSSGFGTVVLEHVAPNSMGGEAVLARKAGELRWHIRAPRGSVTATPMAPLSETARLS